MSNEQLVMRSEELAVSNFFAYLSGYAVGQLAVIDLMLFINSQQAHKFQSYDLGVSF